MESGRCLDLGARASAHVPLAPLRQASGFIAIVTARVPRSSFYLAFPQAELLSHSLIPDSLFRLAGGKKCVVLCVVLCVCARISPSATDSRSPTLLCLVLCARAAVFRHATKQTQKHGQHALLLHGRRVCLREVSGSPLPPAAPPPPAPRSLVSRRVSGQFLRRLWPSQLGHVVPILLQAQQEAQGESSAAAAALHRNVHRPPAGRCALSHAQPCACAPACEACEACEACAMWHPQKSNKVEHILIVTPILFVDPSLCRSAARCGSVSPVLDQKAERSGFWGKPTSAAAATLSFPFFPKAQTVKQDRPFFLATARCPQPPVATSTLVRPRHLQTLLTVFQEEDPRLPRPIQAPRIGLQPLEAIRKWQPPCHSRC